MQLLLGDSHTVLKTLSSLIRPCILAGAPTQHTVLDPFMGSGTTGYVALSLQRNFIGIELNHEYLKLAKERIGTLTRSESWQ